MILKKLQCKPWATRAFFLSLSSLTINRLYLLDNYKQLFNLSHKRLKDQMVYVSKVIPLIINRAHQKLKQDLKYLFNSLQGRTKGIADIQKTILEVFPQLWVPFQVQNRIWGFCTTPLPHHHHNPHQWRTQIFLPPLEKYPCSALNGYLLEPRLLRISGETYWGVPTKLFRFGTGGSVASSLPSLSLSPLKNNYSDHLNTGHPNIGKICVVCFF